MNEQGTDVQRGLKRGSLEAVHVAAIGMWLGAVVMTGFAAARIFPIVKGLDPHLAKYEAYTGEHWLIVAGMVANSIFYWAGIVQFVCAGVVVGTLVCTTVKVRRPVLVLAARWAGVLLVLMCLGYNMFVLRPRMAANVEAYWSNALAGKNEEARVFQSAFDADHPVATRVFAATAVALLLGIGVTGWAWGKEKKAQVEVVEKGGGADGA